MILSLLSNGAGGFTLNELKSALYHDDTVSLNDEFKALVLLLNVRLREKKPWYLIFLRESYTHLNIF